VQVQPLAQQSGKAGERSEQPVTEICAGIDKFCEALLGRLDKEEKELFAVARSVIGGETWFAIANKFLLHDAHVAEARRSGASLPAAQPPGRVPAAVAAAAKALAKPIELSGKEEVHASRFMPKFLRHRRYRPAARAVAE
jgi:hypothetical protein